METDAGLFLLVDYALDVFEAPTALRLMEHLGALLADAAADPSRPLASLPLLSAAERQQALHEWNDTAALFPSGLCLHELFMAQALADPAAVAIVAVDGQWTYGELDRRSNRLAHHLIDLGVGPDVLVGVAMRRSPETLMALLAVLKAGGAYIPIDPDYPAERQAQMLEDALPAVMVTDAAAAAGLPSTAARMVLVDRDREAVARGQASPPPRRATPGNLAYVLYTSGSTGRPTGVMVDHAAVVNTLFWRRREFGIRSSDRVLQSIPLVFDPSIWQLFGTLMNGGRLVFPTVEGHKDAEYLVNLMAAQGVTIADFTPSFLRVVLEQPGIGNCALRHVFIGGEALPVALRDTFFACLGGELHNVYGPTETAIDATSWPCRRPAHPGVVPIGRPMANKQILILDAQSELLPAGVAGELGIAGSGLARGYLGRPGLTAERFRPHPASSEPGARLYRTGDLARFLPDGAIQFLGRIDHQVKVRGVRIELQEIEIALAAHPGVGEAVVLARQEAAGGNRLEAYVVAAGSPSPTLHELIEHLRNRLPQAMVPAALFVLDALPMTSTDKVDRQALAARGQANRLTSECPFMPPRTPEETLLAEIWCEVLGREQIGVEDNFFEAGGDSILSIQIVARAGRRGLRLSPRQVFLHQTIAELATVAVPVRPGSEAEQGRIEGPVPLTPVQSWFFEQASPEPWHFNQAIRLELARPLSPQLLDAAVTLVAGHHDALRLRFQAGAEGVRQQHAEDGPAPFAALDLSALPAGRRQVAAEEAEAAVQTSLDLVQGPLLRAVLFLLGDGPARLLLVAHHLVVDGISWRLLLEDLQAACARHLAGLAVELPPKSTSFRGWAERLAEAARSPGVASEAEHWLAVLGRPAVPLPVDLPRSQARNVDVTARTVAFSLDRETTAALLHEVPAVHHARIDETLLTALTLAFSNWAGSRSLLVDLEGHGREQELFAGLDLSRTVGWFTCIYPVRLELGREAGPVAALRAVKEQLRAVPGRGLGFGLLSYLQDGPVAAKLRALPRPELSFNYLGQFERAPAPDALFRHCGEAAGRSRSPLWPRRHLVEVNGLLADGRLHFQWRYSETLHRRTTIEALTAQFQTALQAILASCHEPEADGRTVSDFQLIQGNQEQLDRLMSKFSLSGKRRGQP
jgi:amino acid adenylation domain-containing protein/non-ribosomal peptide synthase protein (TIGR01720 family)